MWKNKQLGLIIKRTLVNNEKKNSFLQQFSAIAFPQTLFLRVMFYPDKMSQKMMGGEFVLFSP